MQSYGRGQTLGSGINPESFKMDFSGFANAANTQAQGLSNLGASIGGAISEVGDYFKKQKEDEQKVQKSLSVAKAIGDLIPGLKPAIKNSLNILNDKEIPLSQRTAEADAIADILNLGINEVRNRQDVGLRERELGIQEAESMARMAPPIPEPFRLQDKVLSVAGGEVLVKQGNDGQTYDPSGQYPVYDLGAFLEGQSPEVYSNPNRAGVDPATGIDELSSPEFDGGVLPAIGDISDPSSPRVSSDNSRLIKEAKKDKSFRRATPEEAAAYGAAAGQIDEQTGRFYTVNLQSGMTVESDGQGGIKVVQGAGVGAKTEKQERAAKFQETRQTNFIIDKVNEAEEIIDNSIATYGGGTLIDMAKSAIPGTQEYKLKNQILPALKDSIALDSLKQLKEASPTGSAGLGSLTEKEGKRLENMYGVLDVGGDKVTLKNDIKRLKQTAFDYIHGSKDERKKAIAEGKITKDQNDQVEQMYREQILGVTAPKAPASSSPFTLSPEAEDVSRRHPTGK